MATTAAPDIIFRDAVVHTVDPDRPKAAAVAVTRDKISAVGDEADVMAQPVETGESEQPNPFVIVHQPHIVAIKGEQPLFEVEASLADPAPLDPVEKSLAWLAECGGQVSMDALANAASLSPRQFRRICVERTGLSPKHLARVLRFRQATKYANGQRPDWADVAIASGYYDQAHLINEFKELAGVSPAQFSSLSVASHFRSQSTL